MYALKGLIWYYYDAESSKQKNVKNVLVNLVNIDLSPILNKSLNMTSTFEV
ncbi:hypothetical protein BML2496_21100 [Providencia rettgeri]|nr:hypothetical protein BML2496_21100 [Providencia rettgeri]